MAKKKRKKHKGLFMRIVVIFCIAYVVRVIEQGMTICEQQSISPSSIVTAAIAFFGAELGLCVVKRIWAKEDKTLDNADENKTNRKSKVENPTPIDNDFQIPL